MGVDDDRLRFGGLKADFSPYTMRKFAQHLGRGTVNMEQIYTVPIKPHRAQVTAEWMRITKSIITSHLALHAREFHSAAAPGVSRAEDFVGGNPHRQRDNRHAGEDGWPDRERVEQSLFAGGGEDPLGG